MTAALTGPQWPLHHPTNPLASGSALCLGRAASFCPAASMSMYKALSFEVHRRFALEPKRETVQIVRKKWDKQPRQRFSAKATITRPPCGIAT